MTVDELIDALVAVRERNAGAAIARVGVAFHPRPAVEDPAEWADVDRVRLVAVGTAVGLVLDESAVPLDATGWGLVRRDSDDGGYDEVWKDGYAAGRGEGRAEGRAEAERALGVLRQSNRPPRAGARDFDFA